MRMYMFAENKHFGNELACFHVAAGTLCLLSDAGEEV